MNLKDPHKVRKYNHLILNISLILLVILLAVVPFIFNSHAKYLGSDIRATEAISQIDKNYKPWFRSVWVPPSGEIESLLFALQAALGAGVVGYGLGYMKGKSNQEERNNHVKY